ncbi:MAG: ABC transporter permease [Thermoplasmata archaeon]|nr:ABC transporter permease [Thermoplasmata archaeon]
MAVRMGQGTIAFALTELRVQLHEGLAIATSMIVQVVLLVFVVILAPALLPYALIGAVVYSVFQLGQRIQNEAAFIRIDHKLNELYHASSLSAEGYFLGLSLGVLFAYLPPVVILLLLIELVAPLTIAGALVLVAVVALIWLFTCALGYIISTLFRDMRAIWPYASLLTNFFGVLPPVFYPIGLLPGYWHPIALAIPSSAAVVLVEAAQGGLVHLSGFELVYAATSLTVEALALFGFAIYWARVTARER